MNDIKIGQLYQHTPTGIVRRVVLADNNRVTFKEDATSHYSHCSIKDFKKYWRPYEVPNVKAPDDKVNHPSHYTWLKDLCGIEVIDITRYLDFDCGNAVKYLLRAGHKSENGLSDDDKKFEDISKARWYCQDAMHLYNKHKYLYPKNNHLYTKISEVRCKDVTTGNWYDAVLYGDANGQYVREVNDFNKKFKKI